MTHELFHTLLDSPQLGGRSELVDGALGHSAAPLDAFGKLIPLAEGMDVKKQDLQEETRALGRLSTYFAGNSSNNTRHIVRLYRIARELHPLVEEFGTSRNTDSTHATSSLAISSPQSPSCRLLIVTLD